MKCDKVCENCRYFNFPIYGKPIKPEIIKSSILWGLIKWNNSNSFEYRHSISWYEYDLFRHGNIGICQRYPESETKLTRATCGEFKEV